MKYLLMGALLLTACGQQSPESGSKSQESIVYEGTAMVMLDSSRKYKSGMDIELNTQFTLSNGQEIDFHLSNGSTVTLKYPASGKLGQLLKVDGAIEKWTQSAIDILSKSANDTHVLTVRSGGQETGWIPTAIPVPTQGQYCIQAKAPTFYVPGKSLETLNFDLVSTNGTATLTIPAGVNAEIEWPSDLPVAGDFELKNKAWFGSNKISVTQLETFDFPSMAKAGCAKQLENFRQFAR